MHSIEAPSLPSAHAGLVALVCARMAALLQNELLSANALRTPQLRALAARGVQRSFRKGAVIIEEGSHGDTLYLMLAGRVKACSSDIRGREIVYGVYGPGDYFGEMSLDGGPRSASVVAETACACAMLTRQTLREHIRADPEFAFELITRVIWRARRATQGAKAMALLDTYGRLVQLLESLASEGTDGARVVLDKLTHAQIAGRLGCSREMVSRLMKDLEVGGYVAAGEDGRLRLLRPLPARW
jgi:CRP/FNR family cyclic AMP-dependent transcriptional regulator